VPAARPGAEEFLAAIARNPVVVDVLARAEALALPGWYLAAGCLPQP
jgi:hypothetical protein